MAHIVFFNDSPVFGGHEKMALEAIRGFVADPDHTVTVIGVPINRRFREIITDIECEYSCSVWMDWHRPYQRGEVFRQFFAYAAKRKLYNMVAGLNADVIVSIQGCFEISSLALHACRGLAPIVSYIPLPHTWRDMGASLANLRDNPWSRRLVQLPDAFITIGLCQQTQLRNRGAQQPITVVPNVFDPQTFLVGGGDCLRSQLNIPKHVPLVGLVGRVEFKQKRQDAMLQQLSATENIHALIVGDGPDLMSLRMQVERLQLADRVHFLNWTDNMASVYQAVDVVVIGSRYEGVPLTMLESLACGVPVIAAKRDGMVDHLSSECLFDSDVECLQFLQRIDLGDFPPVNQVPTIFSRREFQRSFKQAVLRQLELPYLLQTA